MHTNPVNYRMQTHVETSWTAASGTHARDALLVRIGREYVAVWLDAVVSQLENLDMRPLPDWHAGVAGLLRDGERYIPLYRPELALGIARDDASVDRCAIVVRSPTGCIALAIDEAMDVLSITADSLRDPPPAIADDGLVESLTWSGGGMLVCVLNPAALVATCRSGSADVLTERSV